VVLGVWDVVSGVWDVVLGVGVGLRFGVEGGGFICNRMSLKGGCG